MSEWRPLICIATSIHPDYDARVLRHARSVAEMGYEVDLICPWEPRQVELPPGLRLVTFPRASGRRTRSFQVPLRMLPLLLGRPYRLYHFHDLDILWLMALLKLVRRRPVVYDCHENYAEEMYNRVYLPRWSRPLFALAVAWYERIFAAMVREVVLVVPKQLQTFRSSWFRKVMVRNFADRAIERDRRRDLGQRPPACISIASQYVNNGALLVLDVAREVTRRRPEVKFLVVDRYGTDLALRSKVLAAMADKDLAGRMEMLPNVLPPRIMDHLNGATIGLLLGLPTPTLEAGLPTKLFEYMAAGLPIVAADHPTSRQVITEAGCGVLVKPGDVGQFVDAICRLLEDPAAAAAMGERGVAAFLDRFSWDAEVGALRALYRRLLGEADAPA